MENNQFIYLGKTGIKITPIGFGTMQWRNRKLYTHNKNQVDNKILSIFQATINSGINLFDTAEIYGNGSSEIALGQCMKQLNQKVTIATKFLPYPWRLSKNDLKKAVKKSLTRLGVSYIDLYQVHWPLPPVPIKTWMDAMADIVSDGLIKSVGVSNYSAHQTEQAYSALAKRGIPLASNQIHYSLLHRNPEKNGVITKCNELGVSVIAYSPLEIGLLTGKYSEDKIPADFRAWRYNLSYIKRIDPLLQELHNIGKNHNGKTPGQVSLNWLIAKGAIPIPSAKNVDQAISNAGGFGWQLTAKEIQVLDEISNQVNVKKL